MNKTVSIYGLLKTINLIILGLMIFYYQTEGGNQYINGWTIVMGSIMALTTHVFLQDASKNENPMLGVLAFAMLLYFELRILTLNYTDSSTWIQLRTTLPPSGINGPLFYILLGYIVAGIALIFSPQQTKEHNTDSDYFKTNAARNIIKFLFVSLILSALPVFEVPGTAQICGILSTFFLNMLFMMLYAFVFFIRSEHVSKKDYYLFILFLFVFVGVYTIIGSRSTLLKIVTTALFALLALNKIRIKRKYILIVLIVAPLSLYLYILSTISRALDGANASFEDQKEIVEKASARITGDDLKAILAPVFDRLGYLDYATEIIYNRPHLSQYLTIPNYIKSVVDNLLTPGFDIFDMPKMSNVISKTYYINKIPTKKQVDEWYQSDALTVYGEIYVLFGPLFALPILFLLFRLIQNFYSRYRNRMTIKAVWVKAVVIYELNTLIISMGLDWIVIDLVAFIINYYIFCKLTLKDQNKPVQRIQ